MTGTMADLVLAAVAFIASHVGLSSTPLRAVLVRVLGVWPFTGLYSLLSVVLLIWLAMAYADAPYVETWVAGNPARHLALSVMVLACILLVSGFSPSSPTGMAFKPAPAPPVPAGIFKVTRHPVMWAIGLWALVHMAANGDVASLVFFGSLGGLALVGTVLIDRKKRAALGEEWRGWEEGTSNLPFAALITGRASLTLREIGYGRLVAGLILYAVFFLAHEAVIGVTPFHV